MLDLVQTVVWDALDYDPAAVEDEDDKVRVTISLSVCDVCVCVCVCVCSACVSFEVCQAGRC